RQSLLQARHGDRAGVRHDGLSSRALCVTSMIERKAMDIEWSLDECAFRDEVREFFAANLTDELRAAGRLMTSVYSDHEASLESQRILVAECLAVARLLGD